MRKHQQHFWKKILAIAPWYFLVAAVISGVICVFALRANNEHMIALRAQVYAADQKNTSVEAALKNLQVYVTSHMNTDLAGKGSTVYPPIQLKYTYERLVAAQGDQIAKDNLELYTAAQAACEAQNHTDFSGRNRVPCIEQYVLSHNPDKTAPVPDALYKFAFVSPRWSPDLAGWSMAVAAGSSLLFIVSLLASRLRRS